MYFWEYSLRTVATSPASKEAGSSTIMVLLNYPYHTEFVSWRVHHFSFFIFFPIRWGGVSALLEISNIFFFLNLPLVIRENYFFRFSSNKGNFPFLCPTIYSNQVPIEILYCLIGIRPSSNK